jgi:ribonuclease Z
MHLLGREKPLHIYSPPGLKEIIDINHHHSKTFLRYELIFHVIEESSANRIFDDEKLSVDIIPMNHRIPCYGFLFREKPLPRNIIREKINEYGIPVQDIPGIKKGQDFISGDGSVIPNAELTTDPASPRSYAYCSDTIYNESYLEQIKNVNLLYHEATFAEDFTARAKETYHCTAKEAATIAQKSEVQKLIIGHYSARYHDLEILLNEAKQVFPDTVLAIEGEIYKVS